MSSVKANSQGTDRQDRGVRERLQQKQGAVQLDCHGRLDYGAAPADLLKSPERQTRLQYRRKLPSPLDQGMFKLLFGC
jgi:hypothetical protein